MTVGQLQTVDKLPHEFEVKVKEGPAGTSTQLRQNFAGAAELSNADMTVSITNLGKKPIQVNPASEGMEPNQILAEETKQVFIGKFGTLIPGFFIGTGDQTLHYRLTLLFEKEQTLSHPLRVSLVWIPPSL